MEHTVLPTDAEIGTRHAAVAASRTFRNVRDALGLAGKRVLDAGCGYGEYLALFGAGSIGLTTTRHEVEYGTRHSLDIREGNVEALAEFGLSGFDAVWANNLFEHLVAPHAFLMELREIVGDEGRIVLGVPVVPAAPFLMRFRKFRGALASNHINFFTRSTLRLFAERAGWKVEAVRPFIFKNPLLDRLVAPIAPHLYLVARKDSSFSYPEKKRKEWEGEARYARLLALGTP